CLDDSVAQQLGCQMINSLVRRSVREHRQPGPSPPFPYTALFRSAGAATTASRSPGDLRGMRPRAVPCQVLADNVARHVVGEDLTDRKSTRLNSSHVKISYAVFCLKKKRRTRRREQEARQR